MEFKFDDWKKALEDFQSSVTKDLEEIRQHKEEVRQLKSEIFSMMGGGYFLRDDHRVVISAPEVIIGNVDRDGVLMGDGSSVVVLRGQKLALEGVGDAGSVHTRAASIRQTAVDPGIDGQESVVHSLSEVVSQATRVALEANDTAGVFSQTPHMAGDGGVSIHADGQLLLEASASSEGLGQSIDDQIKQLEDTKKAAETDAKNSIADFGALAKSIQSLVENHEKKISDAMELRANVGVLEDHGTLMDSIAPALYQSYQASTRAISCLAEINRRIACLKEEKDGLKKADAFKKESTGASVAIFGERVDLVSRDGDGNLRDNPESGVNILANSIGITALDAEGALQPEGKLLVNAQTVEVSTVNTKELKYNDKGELESAQYTSEGDVLVRSKTVTVTSVDSELKDGKVEEKALTKDSALSIRTEKVDVSATDTEGKATGGIALNAKSVAVRSMDVEKEKRTDDKLAAGSTMLLLSEKMFVGAKNKDIKSKKVQAVSEEMGLFADKTLEVQQGEQKAVLQLADGKAALSGDKTDLFGDTTVNAKAEIKGDLKAPKAAIDNLEAKSSFKSPNISDGFAAGGGGGGGSLSAKLKAEDAPAEEKK